MEPRSRKPALQLFYLIKRNVSAVAEDELRKFLLSFNPEKRKRIINTHFTDFHEKTSVHLTAEMNKAPFLQILLEYEGEYYYKINCLLCMYMYPLHIVHTENSIYLRSYMEIILESKIVHKTLLNLKFLIQSFYIGH